MAGIIQDDARLHRLCHNGKMDDIKGYLNAIPEENVDDRLNNRRGVFGYTPLHEAVSGGHDVSPLLTSLLPPSSPHSHPVIPLFGGVLLPLVLRSSWQLSSIQPLGDEWVVVSHENTVLVLEPQSLTCIGGISLGQSIIDMATDRRSVYLLCKGHQRKIVKLSMPAEEPTTAVLPQPSPVEEKEVKMEEEVRLREEIRRWGAE